MSATVVKLYLQSVKDEKVRYEILAYDEKAQSATIKGRHGAFEMKPFTKDAVTKKGYKLVHEAA